MDMPELHGITLRVALQAYGEAIRRNPSDPLLYSNRAAAFMKLIQFPAALQDCDKALELDPDFGMHKCRLWSDSRCSPICLFPGVHVTVKGHTRKGNCLFGMKEYMRAVESFERALALDASNKEAQEGSVSVPCGNSITTCLWSTVCATGLQRTMAALQMRNQSMSEEQRAEEALKNPEVAEIMADPAMRQILQQMQENPSAAREYVRAATAMKRLTLLYPQFFVDFAWCIITAICAIPMSPGAFRCSSTQESLVFDDGINLSVLFTVMTENLA